MLLLYEKVTNKQWFPIKNLRRMYYFSCFAGIFSAKRKTKFIHQWTSVFTLRHAWFLSDEAEKTRDLERGLNTIMNVYQET